MEGGQRKDSQLDLLLLKAESYSQFILENQKRTQAMLQATKQESTPKTNKKRKASSSSTGKKKGEVKNLDVKEPIDNENQEKSSSSSGFTQPPNLVGGTLMTYQVEGLQWLLSLWENGLNGILADEMGLGKTIQIIALIAHLRHNKTAGPYLIAGPLATITNWEREFKKWLPSCPVLLYHADKDTRAEMRKQLPVSSQKSMDFPVVITSFEICMQDRTFFDNFVWQYVILDEGHRIKNRNCKLVRELKAINSVSRLLLTGTPIQNTLEELWSLLNFCSPMIFDDLEVFHSWFGFKNIGQDTKVEDILDTEEQNRIVTKLHEILRPFVLRRLKTDVLSDRIPPKREIVIYCGMSALQQEYYAQVMNGTIREYLENSMKVDQINKQKLQMATMQYRKVCNHPFLFGDLTDEKTGENLRDAENGKFIVMASGKFLLLHRMLTRLKREGHKVLIFSQMTKLLDILEDYLYMQDHSYVRFDGSTKLADRQEYIDKFNDKDSDVFIFLLSTRSGGLGVNLATADTVILFDSDWNPTQDCQAQDRCHRIGQLKGVIVYRLLTSGSIEIDVMKRQISKRKLERLTIQGGDYRKAGKREGEKFTLNDLKLLLKDDVSNLSRMEKVKKGKNDSISLDNAVAEVKKEDNWISHNISDHELDLIMNRKLIFSTKLPSNENIDSSVESPVTSVESYETGNKNDFSTNALKKERVSEEQGIPLEGEMYDMITAASGGTEMVFSFA